MTVQLNNAWKGQLFDVYHHGSVVVPRGLATRELLHKTLHFDMNHPVVTIPERRLGYKFMAAEAWWLLSGRNDVASIAPYSKRISEFSDDGSIFFGSYGPPFVDQLKYVVETLEQDPASRQAIMTFWRPNPGRSKDIPCTVALSFMLRGNMLYLQVFMRSSDNWLGIPYDAFNFTMMACRVLEQLNLARRPGQRYILGDCYLTAASSHIYGKDFDGVQEVLKGAIPAPGKPIPRSLYGVRDNPEDWSSGLIAYLEELKDNDSEDRRHMRWWQW